MLQSQWLLLGCIMEAVLKPCPQPGRRKMAGGGRKRGERGGGGISTEPVAEAREAGVTEPPQMARALGPAPPLTMCSLRKLLWLQVPDSK